MADRAWHRVNRRRWRIDGVINSLENPTDVADWKTYITRYDGTGDGKYAVTDAEVRLLVNPAMWRHCMGLEVGTNGNSGLLRDKMPRDRFVASVNMPATAS